MATGIILLTYLALWLQYTPADATGVDGMQFRYFLPLSGIFTLCACECVAGPGCGGARVTQVVQATQRRAPHAPYPNLQPYLPQQTLHGLKHHGIGNHRK